MFKKIICLTISTLIATAAITGCTKPASSQSNTSKTSSSQTSLNGEISFMGWGYESEKTLYSQMIKDFMTENRGVKVKYVISPSDQYDIKLNAMIQAKKAPDVFFMKPENLMAWADSGKILNLQSFADGSKNIKDNILWKSSLDRWRYDGKIKGQGDLWALPKDIGPWSMVYNKKIFAEKGITAPTITNNWDWNQFVENTKKLTYTDSKGKKIYGTGYYMLESAVWSNGADFISADNKKVTVDTAAFTQAMQWVADLRLKEFVMPSITEDASVGAYPRWLNGNIAIFAMGPWDQASFWKLPYEWDLMPWPKSPNTGKSVTWLGTAGYCISSDSKYKDSSFALAAYFSSDEKGQRTNFQLGASVPNIIAMAKNEYGKMNKAPVSKDVFFNIIETGRGYANENTYNSEWLALFWQDATKVWSGEVSAAKYCADVQPKMQKLLDKSIELQNANKK
jgi:multiple sugar transport system substrate-binding protein